MPAREGIEPPDTRIFSALSLVLGQPAQYGGKVHLFRAHFNLRGYPNPVGALGWDRYCSDLEVLELPCNHSQILLEPQVLRIAAHIESLLSTGSA